MKVCLVNSYYPPWVGGAETYVSSLAKGLTQDGNEVTVYCASSPLIPGESFDGHVRVRRMRAPLRLYGTPIAISPFNLFLEDYDVIHCNFPGPYLAALFSWFGKMRGIPTVLTWHNDLPKVTSAAGLLVRVHDLLAPTYLENYSRIIATTNVYAKSSPILRGYAKKVTVIPNGVDTERFSPALDGRRIRESYGFQDDDVVALFVGALTRWHSYKGVDDLIRSFKIASTRNEKLRLLVVGSGSLVTSYSRLVEELGLRGKVGFGGRVSGELLPYYYAASDFGVLPSKDRSEGFGLVLLEAMASGRPVIGSNVGGVAEVVASGETGLLVEPGDAGQLAQALVRLGDEKTLRDEMGRKARLHAEGHAWSNTVRTTEQVYREVSGKTPLTQSSVPTG